MTDTSAGLSPEQIEELKRRKAERAQKAAGFNDQRNAVLETDSPDDAAYDISKAKELGIPREAIGGARDEYKNDDLLARMEKMRNEAPKTSAWLAQPENYAVAKDEVDDLGFAERAVLTYADVRFTGKAGEALAALGPAFEGMLAGLAASTLEAPGLTPVDAAIMANLDKVKGLDEAGQAAERVAGAVRTPDVKMPAIRNPFAKAKVRVPEVVEQLPDALSRARTRASTNALAAAIDANARRDAAMPVGVTPESNAIFGGINSAGMMGPALATGILTRRADVPMAIMGRQVYGSEYAKGRAEGLTPGGAALYAGAQSGIERGTERLGLEILFGKGFVGKEIGKRLFASILTEQAQEQVATISQDFVDWKVLNPEKTAEEFMAERGDAAYQTAIATLVASAPSNALVLGTERMMMEMERDAAGAEQSRGDKMIADVLDKAGKTKLAGRSPEKLADLLDRQLAGSPVETISVDLDGVVDALAQKGIDPTATLEALGVSQDALAQKWERFGEAEVKLSTLAASPALRGNLDAIQPHVRAQEDTKTPAQKEAAQAGLQSDIKAMASVIQENLETGAELEAKQQQVVEAVRERIRGAAVFAERTQENATVATQAAMVNTFAARLGVDPMDFYNQHFPRVQTSTDGMIAEADALEQARADGFEGTDTGEAPDPTKLPLDQRSAREVLELLAERSSNEDGGEWMEGLLPTLRAAGIVGARYVPGGINTAADAPPQTQSIVIFDERAPVLLTDQAGNLMQEKRGQYSPSQNVITMFESRDITTMMHEGAHWYLDMLEKMAAAENPHPFVTEQLAAIEGWYAGLVKSGKRPALEDADRWRDRQETFAETFEAYLQTGKAPSSALRDAFRAFKSWVTALWRDIRSGRIQLPERANLNPEISAVLDRMLAVDEEIDAQAAGISVQANEMAKALLDKGIITQAQFDKTAANLDAAREKTKEDYLARILDDLRREKEAEYRTEERRTKGDVTREFDVSPVGRLISWLGYGQWKGDVPVGESAGRDAGDEFYQGTDRGEAQEWAEAVAKGLPMDQASRMARAREQGWVGGYYHGTTANVEAFDLSKANPESDWGAGVYLSNTPGDVANNYAGLGPDLTNKIDREAERIANETNREYNDPEVIAEARAKWVANEGMTMPLMVRLSNPVTVGGPNETKLTYEEAYNDELDEYGEPTGTLIDFIENLRSVSDEFMDADADAAATALLEKAMDDGEVGIFDVQRIVILAMPYVADPNTGDIVVNEVMRQTLERMGFDGIIDNTVDVKFGSQRRTGGKMAGMTPDTVHTIVFDPANIRSVHAAFDPDNSSSANLLAQSIRTAARMPMAEVDAWVRANITADESTFPNGDTLTVVRFPLTEDDGAPEVMLSIRMKADGKQSGRADVNLFLDNQMADAMEGIEDVGQRGRMAMEMFGKAVLVMRQYAAEYDPRAFSFVAAESQAEGTKAKSREDLYRYMLSSMKMDGYTAYEVESQTSVVNVDADGAKTANPMFPSAGFMLVKDGENVEDFARNEILRGNQRGGGAGEVVTALTAKRLTPEFDASGRRVDRRGSRTGAADPGGAVDDTLAQSGLAPTFYSQLQRVIERSATTRAPASQWLGIIRNAPGVKAEEAEWTGVTEWLEAQDGPVTREALAAFLAGNGVQVEEVVKGEGAGISPEMQQQELAAAEESDRLFRALSDGGQDAIFNATKDPAVRAAVEQLREARRVADDAILAVLNDGAPTETADAANDAVTKAQRAVGAAVRARRDELGAVVASVRAKRKAEDVKWSSYTLPGGENYREMLLTLPDMDKAAKQAANDAAQFSKNMRAKYGEQWIGRMTADENAAYDALINSSPRETYRSSHWSEPNVLAHVRFKERTTEDGKRTLAIEEVQSDWHQAGREGGYQGGSTGTTEEARKRLEDIRNRFARGGLDPDQGGITREEYGEYLNVPFALVDKKVPNAPFKNNAWAELVLKRMIRWAAENGFDSVAWIPGNIQNGRVVEDPGDNRGDFYDKILPNIANKLGKKYGARVGEVKFDQPSDSAYADSDFAVFQTRSQIEEYGIAMAGSRAAGTRLHETREEAQAELNALLERLRERNRIAFHSLPITAELRAVATEQGFPLFQPGDPKGWGETVPPPELPPMRLDLEAVRRDYGEEAVRKLPRPVHDRSRDRNSIDGMMDTIRATAKTLKRKPPKTLLEFIRSRKARTVAGKTVPVKQWGIKGAADELRAMDRPDLINETSGIEIDTLRELADEAGYIGREGGEQESSINDFLDAIAKEAKGEKVYSRYDRQEVSDLENAEQWNGWLDANGIDVFETDQKKLRAQVAKLVTSTAADAVHPDQAAASFGFKTGEEMLNAMAAIGSREKYIAAETKRRMDEEFGSPFTDGTFAEEARIAAEVEMKSRAAEIEMEALARAVGEVAASKMAKDMAMDSLSLMTVKELSRWERFLDAERREMKTSLEALRKGDPVKAFIHKRRQLVNMHLAKAAREKMESVEKTRKDLNSYYTSKGRRDKIAPDYLEKIEAILDGYELRVSKQAPGVQKERLSAKAYVAQMIADGRESEVAPEAMLLAELADAKTWRNLTIDEVDYLAGTIKNLAHLGRTKGRLMREQEKRRFEAIVSELETTLDAAPSSRDDRAQSFTRTSGEKVSTWLRKAHARLTRLEFMFTRLDGKENGALVNQLWKPFAEAGDVETERMRGAAEAMNQIYSIFTTSERNALFHRRVAAPELKVPGKGLTMMDVVVMGLNWGNEGNRKALADGYGWDPAAIEAVLNRVLTDKHWQFIEGVWGLVGSYRTDAFALHKAITGVEPKAVDGITFKLANGRTVKGAYYPLKYDSAQPRADSVRQQRLDEKQALSEMGKSFSKPMTKTGHLIERVGSGGKPVMLSIGVFHEHVANVIHDIAYRRAIIDANKIITNPKFANAYIRAAGREQYDQLLPWLAQIANERKQEPGGYVTDIMRGARRNFSIMAMGLKIGTAVQQVTGILQGIPLIGTRYATQGFVKAFAGGPGMFWSSWNWVSQKSEFMRDRPMGFDRDVREVTNKLQERTPLGPIQRNAFILIGLMDTAVSTSVWIGAYDKAMDGNTPGITKGDEDAAIDYADSVVRRSQVAGRMQDLPAMMRGTELEKLMTVVYSYFSGLYNETASEVMRVRGGQLHPLAFTGNMAILYIIVPLLASTLAGRLFDDDDDEELGVKAAKEVASNAVSTIPFVRDVINATINPQFGYQLSPAGSIIEGGTKATANLATGEGFSTEYATKQSLNLLGLLFGLPTGQMFITGDYIYDLAVGNEDPAADPADAASEALLKSTR